MIALDKLGLDGQRTDYHSLSSLIRSPKKIIELLERIRTYLLIAVQVVLVVGAHSRMCIIAASLATLTRVQTSHHPRIQI